MRLLHHLPHSPFCRKVRLVLAEKRLPFELRLEKTWERRDEFLDINPAGSVPVLADENGLVLSESSAICEYLDEAYPDLSLIGRTLSERAEVRRLVAWFDLKFNHDVTRHLLGEKIMKRIAARGQPDTGALRIGYTNLKTHMEHLGYLAETRKWLAGANLSLADFAAAAHLSSLDFAGEGGWSISPAAQEWDARVKSRPSFRPILGDRMVGIAPPAHYADLDF